MSNYKIGDKISLDEVRRYYSTFSNGRGLSFIDKYDNDVFAIQAHCLNRATSEYTEEKRCYQIFEIQKLD